METVKTNIGIQYFSQRKHLMASIESGLSKMIKIVVFLKEKKSVQIQVKEILF